MMLAVVVLRVWDVAVLRQQHEIDNSAAKHDSLSQQLNAALHQPNPQLQLAAASELAETQDVR